jgi:hypothetical protein
LRNHSNKTHIELKTVKGKQYKQTKKIEELKTVKTKLAKTHQSLLGLNWGTLRPEVKVTAAI